ncbi:hypothetical protein OC834_006576 [Tilletia horrida]|nr:hypothetical protein OC834_006576 [Tilletia horrida]
MSTREAHPGPSSKPRAHAFAHKDAAVDATAAAPFHSMADDRERAPHMLKSSGTNVRQDQDMSSLARKHGARATSCATLDRSSVHFADSVTDESPFEFLNHSFAAPWFRPQLDLSAIPLEELKLLKNFLFFQVRHLQRLRDQHHLDVDVPPGLVITKYEFEYAWRRRKGLRLHAKALCYERRVVLPGRERMRSTTNLVHIDTAKYSYAAAALPDAEDVQSGLMSAAAAQLLCEDGL